MSYADGILKELVIIKVNEGVESAKIARVIRQHTDTRGRIPLSLRKEIGEPKFVELMDLAYPEGWK